MPVVVGVIAISKKSRIRFEISRRGEQAVANMAEIQALVAREAGYMEGNANAAYGENGTFEVSPVQGRFAKGRVVSCALRMPEKPNTKKYIGHDNAKRIAILKKMVPQKNTGEE